MNIPQLFTEHKAALFTGGGWAVHALSMHFPYLRDNGGIVGLTNTILFGRKSDFTNPPPPISVAPTMSTPPK